MPWGPMLISFAVGAFVMFLLHLKENVPADKQQAKTTQQQQKKSSVEPTFDFYTLLPETEVVVEKPKTIANQPQKPIVSSPPEEISAPPEQTQQAATEAPADDVSFMIQVGSFKKLEDADGFRARLAFLGIESKVQTVTIDNTDTWHRVQVGPVVGRSKADALQKQLRDNDIDSLLLRAKHG
ncbi:MULTISPECIES: SPOR domain-containing protein [unclassified Methylophaga]|nr:MULTISPECIES: SPOR domain-containing protein [unclassified Methylophaga]MAL50245.1 sporulation protein [Methylophaga sp.]MAM29390.1 sporulation protein [Flavobacteriaceae bacterium]MBP25535.1 sporulation protein [Methylophaga sp.]HCC81478.1 SPOR domain-containing protein [Methylophaga sp.]